MSRPSPEFAPANENRPNPNPSVPGLRAAAPVHSPVHPGGRRGRGAVSNQSSRFDAQARVSADADFIFDDGWGGADEEPPPLRTTVTFDSSRSVIARNKSPDIGFSQSINPYRGCEHGCIYCFARPTHAYLGLSPGLDFESRILAKPDAAQRLTEELRAPGYRCSMIALGTNTDPYQPTEARLGITREILQVLSDFDHPVSVVTKSALVTRDIDLLAPMAEKGLAQVAISVTTLDRKLARRMEPRAATPSRRLEAMAALAKAGIPVGLMVAPVIPGLTDSEMEAIVEAGAAAGAGGAGYILLRLPLEIKDLFREWLSESVPNRATRVLRLLRECRGGKDYDATFGERMTGTGPFAELIAKRFRLACQRHGLGKAARPLDATLFKPPPMAGDQMTLL
ncbi:MAG: PA0069 family radical SAM protein [Proteobacteria bacterium]|nr:PA0069 family radical SAM protein [Pseudomonadota bacterium]